MFATLLKHEFRNSRKLLVPISIGILAAGSFGYFIMYFMTKLLGNPESDLVIATPMLYLLWMGLILMIALFGLACSIILCLQFYRGKFTDQGYLTFTLPVTTHQILLSSFLNFLIWNVVTGLVAIISMLLMFAPMFFFLLEQLSSLGVDFALAWESLMDEFDMLLPSGILYTIAYIMVTFAGLFYNIALPYLAITLASVLVKKLKLLAAVGIGYAMSMIMGVISSALSIIEGIVGGMITALLQNPDSVFLFNGSFSMIITSFLYLGFAIGGYFLIHYLVKKKLNL